MCTAHNFCRHPEPCLHLEAKGGQALSQITEEQKPTRRCRALPCLGYGTALSIHWAPHIAVQGFGAENDQKGATTRCPHLCCSTYRAAGPEFSQVTMRGMPRTESLGTWVQAELWAVLGLQRSNKLPRNLTFCDSLLSISQTAAASFWHSQSTVRAQMWNSSQYLQPGDIPVSPSVW